MNRCTGRTPPFQSGRVHHKGLNGTAGLPEGLIGSVQGEAFRLLAPSPYHSCHPARLIVNADRGSLHLIHAVGSLILKGGKIAVHGRLQLLLLLQVDGGIDPVSIVEKHLLGSGILIGILAVIDLFLALGIKLILKFKTVYLHQCTSGTVSNKCLDIIPLLYLLDIQLNLLIVRFVVFHLIDLAVAEHLIQHTVFSAHRIVIVCLRIIQGGIVGDGT